MDRFKGGLGVPSGENGANAQAPRPCPQSIDFRALSIFCAPLAGTRLALGV